MVKKSELLRRLMEILAQSSSRADKARRIASTIRSAGDFRWVGLYDVDLERGLVTNIAWSGPDAPAHPTFSTTTGLTSRAITGRETINVGDVANDPDYLTALGTTRSEIIIPVIDVHGIRVVGTIDVESEHVSAFDIDTQSLLEKCARALRGFWGSSSSIS